MKQNYRMREFLEEERPYEKCLLYGASHLTNIELLAVLLRTGTKGINTVELARTILSSSEEEESLLAIHHLTYQKLIKIKGVGKVKAIQILCLSELARRLAKASVKEGVNFSKPCTIAEYYMEDMRHHKQECLKLLMLNTKGKLLGETELTRGTVNASLVSPREIFIEALEHGAVAIILLHNHPSGDPSPSKNDILVTRQVKEAGELIGISLLDHIVIGNKCYISFTEEGLM